MPIRTASLCSKCEGVFRGRWVQYYPSHAPSETDDAYFFDRPLWVHDESSAIKDPASISAYIHHNLHELQRSASVGCQLCALLWDNASDRIAHLEHKSQQLLGQAVGIVEMRDDFDAGAPILRLSFFVHGQWRKSEAIVEGLNCELALQALRELDPTTNDLSSADGRPPEQLVEHIRSWAGTCHKEHPACQESIASINDLPTRLLNVGEREGEVIRLVHSREIDPNTKYVTLSHCWGGELPVMLVTGNIASFQNGFPIVDLPRTFKDAVTFTRMLRIQYIWIDALCILQDDNEDWQRESLRMGSVYSGGLLNIAATSSKDGHGGLFNSTPSTLKTTCVVKATWSGLPPGTFHLVDHSAWERRVEGGPLNKRAWVFQERILAPRAVHFARDQVWWECRGMRACEAYPDGVPADPRAYKGVLGGSMSHLLARFDAANDVQASDYWRRLVTAYMTTKLTKDTDRLIALSGVASMVGQRMGWSEADYAAGCWRKDMVNDLLWRSDNGNPSKDPNSPTWSWASQSGIVRFKDPDREGHHDVVTVTLLDAHLRTIGGPLGQVISGVLRVRGTLLGVTFSASKTRRTLDSLAAIDENEAYETDEFYEALDNKMMYDDLSSSGTLLHAFFCSMTGYTLGSQTYQKGLILQLVQTDFGSARYRRAGWLEIPDDAQWFPSTKRIEYVADYLKSHDDGTVEFLLV